MTLSIVYPSWAIDKALKYCFLCCMEEVLLIIHNKNGRTLPLEEFYDWVADWYDPRRKLITDEKMAIRDAWYEKQEKDLPSYLKPGNVFE